LNSTTSSWDLEEEKDYFYSDENPAASIEDDVERKTAKVYPNPLSETLHIETPGEYQQITFELFDMQGRQVMLKEVNSTESIETTNLKAGMYFYILTLDGKKQSGKLIKN
tara:strand:+ start:151601 stop:151930 length:330 start_codon:yes stop_codon:yes gene_type:complete